MCIFFRYASTSLASLSSNLRQQAQVQLGKSSFCYEADTSQDSIYEDASKIRQVSPTYSEHIYEEIPERTKVTNEDRPLPPIPETSTNPSDQSTKVNVYKALFRFSRYL